MANFSFSSSRAPIYSEELLRRAEDDLIALSELEEFNASSYSELNTSVDSVILAVEAFTKVGNHAILKKNECGIVDFLYGSMAEVAKESEGSLLDAITIIINRVNDSHKDKKRFIQEAKDDLYRNLQHELGGTNVEVSEKLYPNLCAFLTEYPKELEKRKEAEEAKAIEQAKRGVPCVGHVCSDKSISVSKKMPAIQYFDETFTIDKPTDLLSPREFHELKMKTPTEKYGDKFLADAVKELEGMPCAKKLKDGNAPDARSIKERYGKQVSSDKYGAFNVASEGENSERKKSAKKGQPIDKPHSQSELEEFLKFIEKHGDRRSYEAIKELVDMPFEDEPENVDASKDTTPDAKKSEKKDVPILFVSVEDDFVTEVPEDSILEFLELMEMLDEEDDED